MLTRYSLQVKGLATMNTTVKWPIPGLTLVAYQAVLLESVNNECHLCISRLRCLFFKGIGAPLKETPATQTIIQGYE